MEMQHTCKAQIIYINDETEEGEKKFNQDIPPPIFGTSINPDMVYEANRFVSHFYNHTQRKGRISFHNVKCCDMLKLQATGNRATKHEPNMNKTNELN